MRKQNRSTAGFTIVELLIVIVVIAILATISIVAYNGIQARARTSAHQFTASQAERAIMTYALQANGESISLSGTLVGFIEGAGDVALLKPLTGTPDITMYAVYEVINTSANYPQFSMLAPYSSVQRMQLGAGPSGVNRMESRIDTSAQYNQVHTPPGSRVPGNTIVGWVQVSNNATVRSTAYNQAAAQGTSSLSAHAGWNFTGLTTVSDGSGTARMALVFSAAHDQNTRAHVIGWLAQKYGISL